ncbi:sensor histidine kinase [Clostridium transplantifaecale]|uniref:sensor histidine kinase n=1 Tax=Clostridium transplantifaecale TaxID=2479838 RepID=UPI000F63B82A|nr:HAMP domain-containing sensor histidine kinase [Clostridium transplantifaecale]
MLRNREFRRFAIVYAVMAAAVTLLGFLMNTAAGFLAAFSAAAFGASFCVFTKARYNSIARLSNQIDLVLHNADRLEIDALDEGELSILHSEITKMMLRIREQNDALKKEKIHLADSLADIAHQLRTPLTSANLTLSLMENCRDEQERKSFVRETEELLTRMDWLITSLLKISRLDAGVVEFQSEPVDVNAIINAALRPFLIFMELHEIEVEKDVQPGVSIRGDSGWLSEAVQNLLKNCMESVGDHGKLQISCTENLLYTEISIHDSGAGFKTEELPRLFDRFYRGKSTNKAGYGIGLALSRMIIIRQGGTITAKNHPQGGAVFVIRFPKE